MIQKLLASYQDAEDVVTIAYSKQEKKYVITHIIFDNELSCLNDVCTYVYSDFLEAYHVFKFIIYNDIGVTFTDCHDYGMSKHMVNLCEKENTHDRYCKKVY